MRVGRGSLGLLETTAVAQQQDAGNHEDERSDAVADEDLDEGEHVDGLITPVARLVQQLDEVRPPDGEGPVVAAREPDEEKETEDSVREAGRLRRGHVATVLVWAVDVVQLLVAPRPHLTPHQRHHLEQAEAPAHQKVDRQLRLLRTFVEILDA